MSLILIAAVTAPLLAGAAGLLLPRRARLARVALAIAGPGAAMALLGTWIGRRGLDAGSVGFGWMPSLQFDLYFLPDRLGLFYALLVGGVGLLIVLYARAYFGCDDDSLYRFYPALLLFMTAMLGLVLADNFVLMLLFWEMTSISSFLLIGWERDDAEAVKSAMCAFVTTGAGGLALMGGMLLLGVHVGAWSFSALLAMAKAGRIAADGPTTAAFCLLFVGVAAKSAQWPLHFWLPGAMAAPTPVSAYLHSATMVKAGIYLLGRIWPAMALLPLWPKLILPIGAITMILGAYFALRKSDLKLIFAYTTVSQLGLLACMYGLTGYAWEGGAVVAWDMTQVVNHALYKAPLFLLAGAIGHVAHTRELPDLAGLVRRRGRARWLAILLILGAYAMAAGPFTLSFAAKEFFLYSLYNAWTHSRDVGLLGVMAATVAAAALTVALFIRITRTLLLRPAGGLLQSADRADAAAHAHAPAPHEEHTLPPEHDPDLADPPHDADPQHASHAAERWSAFLWLGAALLVAMQFIGGLAPGLFEAGIGRFEINRGEFPSLPGFFYFVSHPGVPLALSAAGVVLGVGLALTPLFRGAIADIHDRLYPAFYGAVTKGGGRVFAVVQSGNVRVYIAVTFGALAALAAWAIGYSAMSSGRGLRWPDGAVLEPIISLLPGYLITLLVCASAILMPLVKERASRILVLGTVGFSVTGVYYFYKAPDLALTQISIEIVSLILFLLVLSQLPRTVAGEGLRWLPRLAIAAAVGGVMFWLTLTSAVATHPPWSTSATGEREFANLGEFFLRNSYHAVDLPGHHDGGGGNNVVNVILVDFRGFDTLGEVTVLGLAALGVWTLLRRRNRLYCPQTTLRNLAETRHGRTDGDSDPLAAEPAPPHQCREQGSGGSESQPRGSARAAADAAERGRDAAPGGEAGAP